MRAKVTSVLGEQPATTLLSLLPSPVEGGFATNNRLDLMETRLRTEIVALRGELRSEIVATNNRIDLLVTSLRAEIAELRSELRGDIASTNNRIDLVETRLRSEIVELRGELRTQIAESALETIRSMRAMFLQLIGVMVSLGGIALAVAKFL